MSGLVSKSIAFGLQNFIFLKSNETAVDYNYYLLEDRKGAILIMRTNKDTTEAKYFLCSGDVDTVWSARVSKIYSYPSELKDPNV
jgi:hypothetical protein